MRQVKDESSNLKTLCGYVWGGASLFSVVRDEGTPGGLDGGLGRRRAWAAAGYVTRIDAAFNQPKVVLYLQLCLPFLLEVAGGLADEVGGGLDSSSSSSS